MFWLIALETHKKFFIDYKAALWQGK